MLFFMFNVFFKIIDHILAADTHIPVQNSQIYVCLWAQYVYIRLIENGVRLTYYLTLTPGKHPEFCASSTAIVVAEAIVS